MPAALALFGSLGVSEMVLILVVVAVLLFGKDLLKDPPSGSA